MMTLKAIKQNNGATLSDKGEAVSHKTGFQVSKCDIAVIPVYKLSKQAIKQILGLFVEEGENLGIWIDGGKAYIDISERISNRAHALKIGRDRKQISVWAWKKGEAVNC